MASPTRSFARSTTIMKPHQGQPEPEDHDRTKIASSDKGPLIRRGSASTRKQQPAHNKQTDKNPQRKRIISQKRRKQGKKVFFTLLLLAIVFFLLYRWNNAMGITFLVLVIATKLFRFVSRILNTNRAKKGKLSFIDKLPDYVQAGRPIKGGPRRALWWAYALLKLYRYKWVPMPRHCGVYGLRRAENRRWIYSVRKRIRGIIAIISGKGGVGKSTIAPWLSAEERIVTEEAIVVLDADSGGGAHDIERFELEPEETISTNRIVDMIVLHGWAPRLEDVNRLLGFHEPTGVGVTYLNSNSEIDKETMTQTLKTFVPAVNALYVDTTPGFKEDNTYGVADAATVPILPANIHVRADLTMIRKTLDQPGYGLRERLARGEGVIVAISAVRWWQFNMRTVYELAEEFEVDPRFIVLLPYNKWLRNTRPVAYNREAGEYDWRISVKYRYALSQLLRLRAEIALEYNRNHQPAPVPGEAFIGTSGTNTVSASPKGE